MLLVVLCMVMHTAESLTGRQKILKQMLSQLNYNFREHLPAEISREAVAQWHSRGLQFIQAIGQDTPVAPPTARGGGMNHGENPIKNVKGKTQLLNPHARKNRYR